MWETFRQGKDFAMGTEEIKLKLNFIAVKRFA